MSRYFVTDPPVPIPEAVIGDTPPNVIWIKARMDVETRGRVRHEIIASSSVRAAEGNPGNSETALLIHNIVRWEGPDLDGVPCDAAHIRALDPTEPHLVLVLNAIGERNEPRESLKKGLAAPSTSERPGAADLIARPVSAAPILRSANGILKLHSRSVSAGDPEM